MPAREFETETYRAEIDAPDPETLCGGCGCQPRPFKELANIEGCSLTPGHPSPAGRCPVCDGLCYPVEEEKPDPDMTEERLRRIAYHLTRNVPPGVITAQDIADAMAEADGTEKTPEEIERARIRDAAPELLDGLEAVVAVADRDTSEFRAARRAIAKARGRS